MMNTQKAYDEIRHIAAAYDTYMETKDLDLDVIELELELDELNWALEEEREELLSDLHNISYCRRPF